MINPMLYPLVETNPSDPAGARYQAEQARQTQADQAQDERDRKEALFGSIATCEARMEKIGLKAHDLRNNLLKRLLSAFLIPLTALAGFWQWGGYAMSLALFPALAYALLLHEQRPKLREAAIDRKYELQKLGRQIVGYWDELNAMPLHRPPTEGTKP